MGFSRVAHTLNREGVPCPRQGHGWSQSGVYEIVRRRLYRGEQVYGQTKWIDRGGTKRKVRTPPEEWIVTSVPTLAIVDEALWQAAHARLGATRQQYHFTKRCKLTGRPPAMLAAAICCPVSPPTPGARGAAMSSDTRPDRAP